jgi:hypothetical protein
MEAALRAGTSGMKRTDLDRNVFKFIDLMAEVGQMEDMNGEEITPAQQRYLGSAMANIFQQTGGDAATIFERVMASATDGSLPQLLEYYGIESIEAVE